MLNLGLTEGSCIFWGTARAFFSEKILGWGRDRCVRDMGRFLDIWDTEIFELYCSNEVKE